MHGVSETRYVEYLHSHIEAILRNMSVFSKYLPLIIDTEKLPRIIDQAKSILDTINSPHFISNLIFCNIVFLQAAIVEKVAQSKTFGPHDYDKVVKSFKEFLESIEDNIPEYCVNLIKCGELSYKFIYRKCQHVAEHLYKFQENDEEILISQYKRWITQLLSNLEEYIGNPEAIDLMIKFFEIDSLNLEEELGDKINQFRSLFSQFNISFLPCNIRCTGLSSCKCVPAQVQDFFNMKDIFKKYKTNEKTNYKDLFRFFLSKYTEAGKKSNITNIMRIMETATLMKCNQSSTERINSVISNIVHGHFEHRYTNPDTNPDMVNAICMLKCNFNMHSINVKLAR